LGYYPFVLGAQPVRPIDLAAFYAAIANEGLRPTPYVVESIERNGETVFRHRPSSATINSVDRAAFYQLKTILPGVLARTWQARPAPPMTRTTPGSSVSPTT
jgi:penicillin-binding protein 1A